VESIWWLLQAQLSTHHFAEWSRPLGSGHPRSGLAKPSPIAMETCSTSRQVRDYQDFICVCAHGARRESSCSTRVCLPTYTESSDPDSEFKGYWVRLLYARPAPGIKAQMKVRDDHVRTLRGCLRVSSL
jgi:hypothetical protein